MDSKSTYKKVGVLGAGSFGTVLANLLAKNCEEVILYARTREKAADIQKSRISSGQSLAANIQLTNEVSEIGECNIIFPAVPSSNFRNMIVDISAYLKPYHIIIHGTKGLDMQEPNGELLSRDHVKTMSEVIFEETSVVRVGCIAGPNLAKEIAEEKPAATVVASEFDEVVQIGQQLLRNDNFLVFGGKDVIGTELCGVLKNIIAIAAGLIHGMKFGENAKALLLSRGLVEMIHIGKVLGADVKPFLGLAGVGDLIATSGSVKSRNFAVGNSLAKGLSITQIMNELDEVAEGVRTVRIIHDMAKTYGYRCLITDALHRIINGESSIQEAQNYLMKLPFRQEVDFLD